MASKSVEAFKHGARVWQTTDRQTTPRRNVYLCSKSLALQKRFRPNCLTVRRPVCFGWCCCSCERSSNQPGGTAAAAPAANPCRDFPCRGGWEPVMTSSGRCTCRIADRRRRRRS